MSALLDLAERCEAATGPDRELDWLIADALGEIPEHSLATAGTPYGWFRRPDEYALWKTKESDPRAGVDLWQPKPRTASLDAAMTLVPEGFRKEVRDSDARGVWAYLFSGTEPADYIEEGATTVLNPHYGQGVTWSLALCAAALRARAAEQSALNREGGNG